VHVAIIPADITAPIRFQELGTDLEAMQGAVGGDIELVGLRAASMNMYINENGKIEDPRMNLRATTLCRWAAAVREGDYIAGDAVLVGPTDDEGEDTSLTPRHTEWLERFDKEASAALAAQPLPLPAAGE
jgi:hypothetical protein